jgi:hypothetical protein
METKAIIEEFFSHGHFDVEMPDGSLEDYDTAVPDFYAKTLGYGECLDSNGSEAELYEITPTQVVVDFLIADRAYEKAIWVIKNIRAYGDLVNEFVSGELIYRIDRIEELPDGYNPYPQTTIKNEVPGRNNCVYDGYNKKKVK